MHCAGSAMRRSYEEFTSTCSHVCHSHKQYWATAGGVSKCTSLMILFATMNVLLPLPKCGATQEWSNDAERKVRHVSEVERHARGKGRASDWRNHTLPPVVSALHASSIYSRTLHERHLTACMCPATGGQRRFEEEGIPWFERRWRRRCGVWFYTTSAGRNSSTAYAGQEISTC